MICFCCNEFFEKGTGHAMFCPECLKVHPMCNMCYEHKKAIGEVKDKTYKKYEYHKNIMEKGK